MTVRAIASMSLRQQITPDRLLGRLGLSRRSLRLELSGLAHRVRFELRRREE